MMTRGRFIRADYGDLSVVSVYHPSGTTGDERQAFKMKMVRGFSALYRGVEKRCGRI